MITRSTLGETFPTNFILLKHPCRHVVHELVECSAVECTKIMDVEARVAVMYDKHERRKARTPPQPDTIDRFHGRRPRKKSKWSGLRRVKEIGEEKTNFASFVLWVVLNFCKNVCLTRARRHQERIHGVQFHHDADNMREDVYTVQRRGQLHLPNDMTAQAQSRVQSTTKPPSSGRRAVVEDEQRRQ